MIFINKPLVEMRRTVRQPLALATKPTTIAAARELQQNVHSQRSPEGSQFLGARGDHRRYLTPSPLEAKET
jgi:hypothetical protein